MKHLLGYVIWNKAEMIEWLFDGILFSFLPHEVDLVFVLDNPNEETRKSFWEHRKKLAGFNVFEYFTDEKTTYKFPCQNILLQYAFKHSDKYKTLICPQDDQKIMDESLIKHLDATLSYLPNIGVIGLRDGFDFGYKNMFSSEWSESSYNQERLAPGFIRPVQLINDGPIIYPIETIKKIGPHDVESYYRFYIEDDYCMKCNAAGLQNFVMGNNLIHDRSMSSIASDHYSSNYGELDLATFRKKWNI